MTDEEYDAQWFCAVCGAEFPVPSMARGCEEKHDVETTPTIKRG